MAIQGGMKFYLRFLFAFLQFLNYVEQIFICAYGHLYAIFGKMSV